MLSQRMLYPMPFHFGPNPRPQSTTPTTTLHTPSAYSPLPFRAHLTSRPSRLPTLAVSHSHLRNTGASLTQPHSLRATSPTARQLTTHLRIPYPSWSLFSVPGYVSEWVVPGLSAGVNTNWA
ncbi:hypothetical protein PMIN06_004612 [Paraphaeosphaeria minitans]